MMHLLPKSHEQRITELERAVEDLRRVVGLPSAVQYGGLQGGPGLGAGLATSNAQQAAVLNQAANFGQNY